MSLSIQEVALVERLARKIERHAYRNEVVENYYTGKNRLKDLRISIPPQLASVESVVGWPGTTVDVLEERLDLEGFIGGDAFGLNDIYRANDLGSESSLGHLDALIYGVGFIIVGKGQDGEPDPLVTIETPKRMTGIYDLRLRRLTAAFAVIEGEGGSFDDRVIGGTLYLENETVTLAYDNRTWFELGRDVHNMGRVPVSRLVNQPRSGDTSGRSEISRAVMSYTDSAMRTLLGAEVAREFYSAPQRYILGAREDTFLDADGNALNPWTVIQGRVLGVPYNDEESVMPSVGQFQANDTRPYFDQIRAYAQMLSAETAIPANYLGFQTDNPASADAIRQMEARLVKRAERRQSQFGRAWTEVAKLALLVRDGAIPDGADAIRPIWRDAATPTRAAAADEATKLIQVGVLLPDSEVTYNRIGLTDSDKEQLKLEKGAAQANQLINNLLATQPATPAQ